MTQKQARAHGSKEAGNSRFKGPFSESRIQRIDGHEVHKAYASWPRLAREGWDSDVNLVSEGFTRACVLGMGGSASGGDIIADWLAGREGVEVNVFKGSIPNIDMNGTLAIACSASGLTQETIQMMRSAAQRKATLVAISGGGEVKAISARLGIPHIQMPKVLAPRYTLPFMLFSMLSVLNKGLGLHSESEASESIREMRKQAAKIAPESGAPGNPSKAIARLLLTRTAMAYGPRVATGVGVRFKNSLNENAKVHAHFATIPEAFHNEVESWEGPSNAFLPVFLRHSGESPTDRKRTDSMLSILKEHGKGPVEVKGEGKSSLAQLASMAYILDMASYYLAIGLGTDPFPTTLLDELKR